MSAPPTTVRLFHLTHVNNLAGISHDGLMSDAAVRERGGPNVSVGMSRNKERRLRLPVHCHQGDYVGDYVPFNFCPRSVMLYILHMANHNDLDYREGQEPMVHLEFDLQATVSWAESAHRHWAFTNVNASASYATFYDDLDQLTEINWSAVASTDFSSASGMKEPKQAEFLVHGMVPWQLVTQVGVLSHATRTLALATLANAEHQPPVTVMPRWYF